MYYKSRNIIVKAVRFLDTTESIMRLDEMLGGVTISYRMRDKPQVRLSCNVTADVGEWVVQKGNLVFVVPNSAFMILFKEEA
ncbi:MAG: hypothetical protein WCS15_04675 [Prevotella sp.]